MPLSIQKIFNANIYLDGTTDLIGRAAEIQLPKITAKTEEHIGTGMVGVLDLPTGLEKMELKIKWAGFYADHVLAGANPFKSHKLLIRAAHETYTNEGLAEEQSLTIHATGSWKEGVGGTIKPRAAADGFDDTISLSYFKVKLAATELLEIDVHNNIWIVGGEDVLSTYRANIGQ